MRTILLSAVLIGTLATGTAIETAQAKGCIKGALVGGSPATRPVTGCSVPRGAALRAPQRQNGRHATGRSKYKHQVPARRRPPSRPHPDSSEGAGSGSVGSPHCSVCGLPSGNAKTGESRLGVTVTEKLPRLDRQITTLFYNDFTWQDVRDNRRVSRNPLFCHAGVTAWLFGVTLRVTVP